MSDDRRMTTDRFYGGVSNRLDNLRSMLRYIQNQNPSRSQLNTWVISNTSAGSEEAVSHHLTFLESIDLIKLSEIECELGEYGKRWLDGQSSETLYEALSSGVKGFDTLLQALEYGPMTDEDIMELLVSEFEEAEMTKPGPAIRHREWLQVLGYIEREGDMNGLTPKGLDLVETKHTETETPSQLALSDNISVGEKLSQEEIETVFDTGFGYRISGINPRRDEQDRRYILLFANEEGPYNDAVTQGRFEYIGEGLEGDQSENSPGNSALIDAHSTEIPIHFFYQLAEGVGWEYQGLVDVVDYEFREQDGREVLVFTIEHQSTPSEKNNSTDWLGTIRSELSKYYDQTGDSVVTLSELYDFSEHRLSAQFPENDNVRAKIRQQLQQLRDQGEVEFLEEAGTYRITSEDDIQQAKTELQRATATEPELTTGSEQYTKSRRRARDTAFKRLVTQAYDEQCAICGSTRETPDGSPEVEAAHIYPKKKAGSDDVRNGIALCRLHHWAFDSGWLSISDEYEVLVKDARGREGYHEFKQLEGKQIRLPDEKEARPRPMFLREHRKLNGFTDD